MNPETVIQHFGSVRAVAETLGITRQAVEQWVAAQRVPVGRAYQIQVLTRGQLQVAQES